MCEEAWSGPTKLNFTLKFKINLDNYWNPLINKYIYS